MCSNGTSVPVVAAVQCRSDSWVSSSTIVPAHMYDDFVSTHAAVAGTAKKLTLATEGPHPQAELIVPQAPIGPSRETDPPLPGDVAILMLTS